VPPPRADQTPRRQNGLELHRSTQNREQAAISQATIAPPDIKTLADLRRRLGGIPLDRIWFHPVEKSTLIRADQALDGGAVLPGFVLRLSDLLDRRRRLRQA
jgi:hypothetical protein